MASPPPHRPRVSRETRLLFVTVIAAVVALWVLARLRFPEQSPSVNPVTPVLTQLAPTPAFGDLAAVVSDIQARVSVAFLAFRLRPGPAEAPTGTGPEVAAALRLQDDLAVALLDPSDDSWTERLPEGVTPLNMDRATGLTGIRVPAQRTTELAYWSPSQLSSPRYLLVTVAVQDTVSLRPVFVSALAADSSPSWDTTVWTLPTTDVAPGTFAFTTTGAFAGLVIPHTRGLAILPASALMDSVDRLLRQRQGHPGWLGLTVQALTPSLSSAIGIGRGVIVTWVDPRGPAAGSIAVADVLESMDDPTSDLTVDRFRARTARLLAGDAITFEVRRRDMVQPVRLTAADRPASSRTLGLAMRRVRDGAEVVSVEPSSAGALAGIRAGDIITFAAGVEAPSPAQVSRAFAAAGDRPLLIGLARGDSHLVVPVSR